jgi:hypothetical protein
VGGPPLNFFFAFWQKEVFFLVSSSLCSLNSSSVWEAKTHALFRARFSSSVRQEEKRCCKTSLIIIIIIIISSLQKIDDDDDARAHNTDDGGERQSFFFFFLFFFFFFFFVVVVDEIVVVVAFPFPTTKTTHGCFGEDEAKEEDIATTIESGRSFLRRRRFERQKQQKQQTTDATESFDKISRASNGANRAIRGLSNLVFTQVGFETETGVVGGVTFVSVYGERTGGESVRVSFSRLGFGNEFTEESVGVTHEEFRRVSAGFVRVCGDRERRGAALDATERTGGSVGRVGERGGHSFVDEL